MEDDEEEEFKLSDLPEEILLLVFLYLKAKDIIRVGCTCRSLREITSQDVVWRQKFRSKNEHLLSLHVNRTPLSNNNHKYSVCKAIWKKLYFKASFAMSFYSRSINNNGERLCAEFVSKTEGNGIRFDDRGPKQMSLEIWIKLNQHKPDGVVVGCQSESVRSLRWPSYHWQILHVGPDRCIRGSLEPYKFLKGAKLDNEWHHIAITASETQQIMFVDGNIVDSIHFGIGHEYHRHFMRFSQLGNGVISHGPMTPWTSDAMPAGKCGWYPFHGQVRELRIWSGKLPNEAIKKYMYCHRVDLMSLNHDCSLIGYWPMNRLVSGPWPWQGSLVSCTSHLEERGEHASHLKTVISPLP